MDVHRVRRTYSGCTVVVVCKGVYLELLKPFEITASGTRVLLPLGAQRLLAYLALQGRSVHRSAAAEQLWPYCTPCRASANLRSSLCHARRVGSTAIIQTVGQELSLTPSSRVDLDAIKGTARQITTGSACLPENTEDLISDLSRELLPGWYDDWLLLERERWSQMRLYALEGLAQQLQSAKQYLPALQSALAATSIDPIRETAHRIIIEIHLAEGNFASAVKLYHEYRSLLESELKVAPSPQMTHLIRNLIGR